MNKTFDTILNIILLVCLVILACQLLIRIKIDAELKEPSDCVRINNIYYCKGLPNGDVSNDYSDSPVADM